MQKDILGKILKSVELLAVLVIALFVVWAVVSFIFSPLEPSNTRIGQIIRFLNENWKPILLLLVPLFYRPIRTFLEEIEEFRGARRTKIPEKAPLQAPKKEDE